MDKFKTITDFYLKSQDIKKRSILLYILREFMDNHKSDCFDISDLNIKTADDTCINKIVLYPTGMFSLRTSDFQMYDIDWITDDVLEDIILKFMEVFLGYENETCFKSTDGNKSVIDIINDFMCFHDYGNTEIHLYSNFYHDLGLDSLDMFYLAMKIEKEFQISLDDEIKYNTVGELIKIVKRKVSRVSN